MFPLEMRVAMARRVLGDLPNVEVQGYSGLTFQFARSLGFDVVVRGLRAVSDFEFEFQLANMSRHLAPEIETVFLTSLLFTLALPPSVPSWQAALGIAAAVVGGHWVRNRDGYLFNPAAMGLVLLYAVFPYAAPGPQAGDFAGINLYDFNVTWVESFLGFTPGAMGATSAAACVLGAIVLIVMHVASWRIMLGVLVGAAAASLITFMGTHASTAPVYWPLTMGGLAFVGVFMATDPVTAPCTNAGKWVFGILLGLVTLLTRDTIPGCPETVMFVLLILNALTPGIDEAVIRIHLRRRTALREAEEP